MATARKQELNALLNPIQKTVSGLTTGFRASAPTLPSFSMPEGESGGWGPFLFSTGVALLVLFALLLIVHYTITPIFSFRAGDGGVIPLANTSDGQLVWTKAPPVADVSANVMRILPSNFTVQQDIYLDNETALSNRKRIFFYRSATPVVVDTALSLGGGREEDILTQYPASNLFMYLSPNTNDLVVSAVTQNPRTSDKVLESVPTLLNIPIKQVSRITVVLLPQLMEVYFNGKLYGTRTFRYPLVSTDTYFYSTPDAFRSSIRAMNLQYWDRPLSSVEVKNASPPLTDKALFNPSDMSGQCA